MGIADRKDRERKELREKIIVAASELFLEHGLEKASIRMIADKIEYSPATIYLHFKDKSELFYVIMERAFQKFFEYFSSVEHIEDPMERLKVLGTVYLKFAVDNPLYYDLMFVLRTPMETQHTDESFEAGERSHAVLTKTVEDCMKRGHFQGHDPMALSLAIWGTVHGLATLRLRDRLTMYPEDRQEQLVEQALHSFNAMVEKA